MGTLLAPPWVGKEDNIVEKILVCQDPYKSKGVGPPPPPKPIPTPTPTEVQTDVEVEIVM